MDVHVQCTFKEGNQENQEFFKTSNLKKDTESEMCTVPLNTNQMILSNSMFAEENIAPGSLILSDSDDDTKISLFLNESDNDEKINEIDELTSPVSLNSKTTKNKLKEDSSDSEKKSKSNKEYVQKFKKCSLIDSDTSEDERKSTEGPYEFKCSSDENDNKFKKNEKSHSPTKKVVRKSAKAAMDTINAIKSETQRLHRESKVSVPYHHPKSCTLKEFMSRKTVLKPTVGFEAAKRFSLKMNKEDLKDYAEFLKKREEEAEKLFVNINREISPIKENSQNVEIMSNQQTLCINSNELIKNSVNKNYDYHNNEKIEIILEDNCEPTIEDKIVPENDLLEKNTSQITSKCEKQKEESNNEKTNDLKIKIISNVQISPAIVKPTKETVKLFKQLITEAALNSNIRPKLKGSPTSIIDLETGKICSNYEDLSGVNKLLNRYVNANCKQKILTNGKDDEMIAFRKCNKERPTNNYFELKNNLMRKIKEQRKIEINKKLKHHREEEEIAIKIFEEEDDENVVEDTSNEISKNKESCNQNKKTIYSEQINEEYDMSHENINNKDYKELNYINYKNTNDEEADDESDIIEDSCTYHTKRHKNKRILKTFDDSSSEDEEINFSLKYPLEITEVENPELNKLKVVDSDISCIEKLCNFKNNCASNDEELLELCSGTFETQNIHSKTYNSQIKIKNTVNTLDLENNMLENATYVLKENIADVSYDAGHSSEDEIVSRHKSKFKVKNNIEYSDDEFNNDNGNKINLEYSDSDMEAPKLDEDAQIATFIDYDSDENEIQIAMTKSDMNKKVNEYFEKEAELSESDWGSADEDEQNLDKYDLELGDEDEFDQEKLKDEIGRIHMRKILDDDAREVKKMQELLFDNEENDGIGRQRQFRWKKSEFGFNLDEVSPEKGNEVLHVESNDEDDEELWRKMKHEREIILKERRESNISSPSENQIENVFENSVENLKMTKITNKSISKVKLNESESKIDSPFLISNSSNKSIRGSFLKRDGAILTKVANITAHASEFEGISTVQSHTGKTKNFVFSILNEKHSENNNDNNNKRKLLFVQDLNSNKLKKMKLQPEHKTKKLIDHLNDF